MAFRLVLTEPADGVTRDVGENIFLNDLPSEYKVYLFYYPGAMPNQDLEKGLRGLGDLTGGNLFVNIGRLNDPDFGKITEKFGIKRFPVVVMTARDTHASTPDELLTAFVRVDSKGLLSTPDKAMESLQELFNLFIQGKITEAMREVKKETMSLIASRLGEMVTRALRGVWEFIDNRDISVSIMEGKFELKRSDK